VHGDSAGDSRADAARAIEVTLADYGVDPQTASVVVTCRPQAERVPHPARIRDHHHPAVVPLPLAPPVLGLDFRPGCRCRRRRRSRCRDSGVPSEPPTASWDETGSILPLICFYGALALLVTLIVASATSLYLERKRLFTLADGAALVGAESFELDECRCDAGWPRATLTDEGVRHAVSSYLASNPIGRFRRSHPRRSHDTRRRSAEVTVSRSGGRRLSRFSSLRVCA
jgi:hypothetical protein